MRRGPPAVAWAIGPSWAQRVAWLLGVLCGATAVAFYLALQPWGVYAWLLLLVALACAGLSAPSVWRAKTGNLQWDGSHWYGPTWSDTALHPPRCVLDLQCCVLLRITDAGKQVIWVWAESSTMDAHWCAFRRALFFRQAKGAPEQHEATSL